MRSLSERLMMKNDSFSEEAFLSYPLKLTSAREYPSPQVAHSVETACDPLAISISADGFLSTGSFRRVFFASVVNGSIIAIQIR